MATKMVSVRLDEGLVAWVDAYAERRGVKRSVIVAGAVESFRAECEDVVPGLKPGSAPHHTPHERGRMPAAKAAAVVLDRLGVEVTTGRQVMLDRQARLNARGGAGER